MYEITQVLASWKYCALKHYESELRLKRLDTEIPIAYDQVSHSFLRIIPKASTYHAKNGARHTNYAAHNVLQSFSQDLHLDTERKVGPKDSSAEFMGISYTEKHPSSSWKGLRHPRPSCDNILSSSSSDYWSTLMMGSENSTEIVSTGSLAVHCRRTWMAPVVKQVTGANGLTFVLFSNSLIIMDSLCTTVKSVSEFRAEDTSFTALDLVVFDCDGTFLVLCEGFYIFYYSLEDLTFESRYLFYEPVDTQKGLNAWNSAMDWPTPGYSKVVFRVYVHEESELKGLWWFFIMQSVRKDTNARASMTISRHRARNSVLPSPYPTAAALRGLEKTVLYRCPEQPYNTNIVPAIVADYVHKTDFILTRYESNGRSYIHFFAANAAGFRPIAHKQVATYCFDMPLDDRFSSYGEITNAALEQSKDDPDGGFFYVTFQNLSIVKFSYRLIKDVVAPYYY